MTKLNHGDIVHVCMRIADARPNEGIVVVCQGFSGDTARIEHKDVVHVESPALQAGDKVRDADGDVGTMLAICRDEASVDYGADSYGLCTMSLRELERV